MKFTDLPLWAPLCTLLARKDRLSAPHATALGNAVNSVQNRGESRSASRPLKSR